MPKVTIRPIKTSPDYKRVARTGGATDAGAMSDQSDATYIRRKADKSPLARYLLGTPTVPAGSDVATIVPGARLKQPTSSPPKMVTLAMSVPGTGKPVNKIAPTLTGPTVRAGSGTVAYTYATPAGVGKTAGPSGPWAEVLGKLAIRVDDGHKATDANRATVYDLYADVYHAARPTAAVSISPASPVTTTSYPQITATLSALIEAWQDNSGAPARSELAYELKVFSAAQYGVSGFDPATSPCVWSTQGLTAPLDYMDGSTPSSEAVAETPDRSLPNGVYRAYARGRRYFDAAQFGAWASLDFTVAVAPPTAPTLTAAADDVAQRVALTITPVAGGGAASPLISIEHRFPILSAVARTNYCAYPGFEVDSNADGIADGWYVGVGGALPVEFLLDAPLVGSSGGHSQHIHYVRQAGDTDTQIILEHRPARYYAAGETVYFSFLAKGAQFGAGRFCVIIYSDNDDWSHAVQAPLDLTGDVQRFTFGYTVPNMGSLPTSLSCCVAIRYMATSGDGAEGWVDDVMISPVGGPYFDGSYPGCAWTAEADASTSVGTYAGDRWAAVRGATDLPAVFGTPTVIFDYEAPRGAVLSYRANVEATVAEQQLVSAWTIAAVAGTIVCRGWNLKCSLDPSLSMLDVAVNADPEWSQDEEATTFRPVGRKFPVIVSMSMGGADGAMTITARTADDWAALEVLREYRGALLLESPYGWSRYIRIISRSWVETGEPGSARRRLTCSYLEVEAP